MVIKISDENFEQEKNRIIGRTIIAIDRATQPKQEWVCGQNHMTLTLDNGIKLEFDGWGYDASGVDLSIVMGQEPANE